MKFYQSILVLFIISSTNLNCRADESNIQFQNFDNKARILVLDWKEDVNKVIAKSLPSSNFDVYLNKLKSYNLMIDYGVLTIPHILELGEEAFCNDKNAKFGQLSVWAITNISSKYIKPDSHEPHKLFFQRYVNWWKNGYEEDIRKFNALYEEYIKTKEPNVIAEIQDIGIRILPEVIDKIESGDVFLIPVVERLVRTNVKETLSLSERTDLSQEEKISMMMEWWKENKDRYSMDYKQITNPSNKSAQEN